jgi:hypothetical protein
MKRIIKDYDKLDAQQRGMLLQRFPNGITNSDLSSFSDRFGKRLRVLELVTADSVMLIRFNQADPELEMQDIEDQDDDPTWFDDEEEEDSDFAEAENEAEA